MKILFVLMAFGTYATAATCPNIAGHLARQAEPAGKEDSSNPVKHIVVIMQENHSFDNYFGALNGANYYGSEIDGIKPSFFNFNQRKLKISVFHQTNLCVEDPEHDWDSVHYDYHMGALDGFVRASDDDGNGSRVMGYYDATDLPYYYALANTFAVGDRYFSSALTATFPNRYFLMAATAFGRIGDGRPKLPTEFSQKTIFDILDQYGITWNYYTDAVGFRGGSGYLALFQPMYQRDLAKMKKMVDYKNDLLQQKLPQVSFLDATFDGEDEHPEGDVQKGQKWTSEQITALMNSSYWKSSALFLTYDENGGFFDHVLPPEACRPDQIDPNLSGTHEGAYDHYDRYGFRVPFVAVSPYAKHHFVSHATYDHTSILKYIENKFNLPALTARDANADGFTDVFDYKNPDFTIPKLPSAKPDASRLCN